MEQKQTATPPRLPWDWSFWSWWVLAVFVGAFIGGDLGGDIARLISRSFWSSRPTYYLLFGLILGGTFGISTAIAQALVLKSHLQKQRPALPFNGFQWVITSTVSAALAYSVGWSIYRILPNDTGTLANHTLFGFAIGVAQWLLLRHMSRRAGWWIVAHLIAIDLSWLLAVPLTRTWTPSIVIGALCYAPITGTAIVWLLSQPHQPQPVEPEPPPSPP